MVSPDFGYEAKQSFHARYGQAMAAWASVEYSLSRWFRRAILPDNSAHVNAEAIFYSARSFLGRVDMLKAALDSRLLTDEDRIFVRKAIKVATDYNTFRSKLAHRVTVGWSEPGGAVYSLQEGDDPFGRNAHMPKIDTEHLYNSAHHFSALDWIIGITGIDGGITPEEGHQRVSRLPKEPHLPADTRLLEELCSVHP